MIDNEMIQDNFQKCKNQLKEEIKLGLNIWSDILQKDYSDEAVYAYSKGSALKNWESAIDYVPILSDVDIHLKVNDLAQFNEKLSLDNAFMSSDNYLNSFERLHKERFEADSKPLHIPRFQIMVVNKLVLDPKVILPRKSDIDTLFGEIESAQTDPSPDFIKKIDLDNLIELSLVLNSLPLSVIDRTSTFEYWTSLRRIGWRVSPAPVRLLTQISNEDPLDIWTWNRTTIVKELLNHGYSEIAESYQNYYLTGWLLYNSDFQDIALFKECISYGYLALKNCYQAGLKILQEKDETILTD